MARSNAARLTTRFPRPSSTLELQFRVHLRSLRVHEGQGRRPDIREHEYGRSFNPTQQEAERKLAAIEGAERAILFSSGMSAVVLALMAYMKQNGHIIFTGDCYRQTRDFAANVLSRFSVDTSLVEPNTLAIEKAIRPNTNIIFTESPTNPYLRVLDIPAIVKVARRHKILTMIDATLATRTISVRWTRAWTSSFIPRQNTSAATMTCWPASLWAVTRSWRILPSSSA